MQAFRLLAAISALSVSTAAAAQVADADAAPVAAMLACRNIGAGPERLACYDAKVADFAAAEKSGDLFVADKRRMRESKKALFGFGSIKLSIFGKGDTDPGPSEISGTIRSMRQVGYGQWEFVLDNGMQWRQTDDTDISPHSGDPIVIKSAALGSYFLRAGKGKWVRAQRVS